MKKEIPAVIFSIFVLLNLRLEDASARKIIVSKNSTNHTQNLKTKYQLNNFRNVIFK